MRARIDVKRSIGGLWVNGWRVGERQWVRGKRLEDAYLKARLLMGGQSAGVNLACWKTVDDLLREVSSGAVKLLPVGRKGYWNHHTGDPRNALYLRIEIEYPRPTLPLESHPCQGTWNASTWRETGCKRPAVGRFRILDPQTNRHRLWWLCAQCGAEGA